MAGDDEPAVEADVKVVEAGFSRRLFALGGSPAPAVLGEVAVAAAVGTFAGGEVGSEDT
jgi:hypothetical protein